MLGYITDPAAPGGLRLADDLPEPQPGPGELVVEVRAFSVNRGELSLLQRRKDGWRPGQDVAGTVARAGPGGPPEGARVVALVDGAGWSERVAAPIARTALLPAEVSLEQAAALPVAGLTALRALRAGGPILGHRVLVTGATGGVGQFAVQLAAAGGAHVTALVSGAAREADASALGAHEVVSSLDGAGPFEVALDGVGGPTLRAAVHRLAAAGTAVTYGTVGGNAELGLLDFGAAPMSKVLGFFVYHAGRTEEEFGQDLLALARLVAGGKLTPRLGQVRDWGELREALDALRRREVRGKAVLTRR